MHRRDGWGHEYPKLLRGVWDSNVTASSRPCPHQKKKTRRNYRRCRRQRYAAKLYGYMDYNPFAQVQDSTSGTNPCALLIHTATAKRRRTATPPHLHTLNRIRGAPPVGVVYLGTFYRIFCPDIFFLGRRETHELPASIPLLTGAAQPGRGNASDCGAAAVLCSSRGNIRCEGGPVCPLEIPTWAARR